MKSACEHGNKFVKNYIFRNNLMKFLIDPSEQEGAWEF